VSRRRSPRCWHCTGKAGVRGASRLTLSRSPRVETMHPGPRHIVRHVGASVAREGSTNSRYSHEDTSNARSPLNIIRHPAARSACSGLPLGPGRPPRLSAQRTNQPKPASSRAAFRIGLPCDTRPRPCSR